MADGVDIDLYAEELEPDFINQESDYNHDGGVDLYDDVITAPSSDDNQSDEVDFNFSDYEYNSHHDASKSSTSPTGHRELHNSRRVALYVGNLTWWTTDQDITDAIHGLGVNDLVEIKFYENRANGQSKGFCVVSLGSEQSSRILMDKLPKKELHGQAPVVTHCNRQALNQFEMQSRKPNPPNSSGRNAPAMGPPRGMPPQGPPRRGGMPGQFSSPIRPPGGPMGHPMSQGHLAPYPPGVGHLSEYGQLPPGMRPNGPPPPGPPGPPMRSSGPPPGPPLPPGMQGPMPPRPGGPGPPPPGMGLQPPPHGSMPMGPRGPPHPDPRGLLPPRSEWNRPPGFPMPGPYTPQPPPPGPPPSQGPPQSRPPGPGPPQSHLPPLSQGPSPHVNPAFFPSQQGQPPPVGPPPNSQSGDIYNRPPPPQYGDFRPPDGRGLPPYNDYRPPPDSRQEPPMSEAEFEEIMGRNRTVSSSAIARAVADASAGEYASAIETLVTAISLIKQSKVANDERCKIIIGSLQDTLHGIESKSYGSRSGKDRGRSRERERSRERDRSSHREKGRSSRRERSRSRDREYRERSRERDRYHDDRYREKERDRERDREREHRSSRH